MGGCNPDVLYSTHAIKDLKGSQCRQALGLPNQFVCQQRNAVDNTEDIVTRLRVGDRCSADPPTGSRDVVDHDPGSQSGFQVRFEHSRIDIVETSWRVGDDPFDLLGKGDFAVGS